jgi:beta-N-acetylhexosaminidase
LVCFRAFVSLGLFAPAAVPVDTVSVGKSAQGRAIEALRVGRPDARRVVLVVGAIHGTELAGRAIVNRLRRAKPARGTALLLVRDLNPDGAVSGTRWNARGVDLNRNFPTAWEPIGRPFDTYHSGAAPFSEPESRAVAELIRDVRPRVTIWYHQHMRLVDRGGGDRFLERLYARGSLLPYRAIPPLPGTATRWQNRTFDGDTAFVVELPAGRLDSESVRRHARAVGSIARAIAPPSVVRTPIPFGAERKRQMRAYARRHYGIDDFRLRKPRVIVEHYTASNSFASAFNTFAANSPDVELGELPGVCAHFLIARDGAVHRLVSPSIMCRHTVGLNWTAIGIEHVGTSDAQVLGNKRQLRASLRLTRSLQGAYGIATRNVIGHSESLGSPFHRERVARLRGQTHGDFQPGAARRYRRALDRLPAPSSLR